MNLDYEALERYVEQSGKKSESRKPRSIKDYFKISPGQEKTIAFLPPYELVDDKYVVFGQGKNFKFGYSGRYYTHKHEHGKLPILHGVDAGLAKCPIDSQWERFSDLLKVKYRSVYLVVELNNKPVKKNANSPDLVHRPIMPMKIQILKAGSQISNQYIKALSTFLKAKRNNAEALGTQIEEYGVESLLAFSIKRTGAALDTEYHLNKLDDVKAGVCLGMLDMKNQSGEKMFPDIRAIKDFLCVDFRVHDYLPAEKDYDTFIESLYKNQPTTDELGEQDEDSRF